MKNVTNTLLTIESRLGDRLVWMIGGSVAATLHGFPSEIHDIDIFTGAKDAYRAEELLGGECVNPVRFCGTEVVRSHFGERRLDGDIKVEVIGAMQTFASQGYWRDELDVAAHRVWVNCEGISLPIASTSLLIQMYRELGRQHRAETIAAGRAS